MNFNWNQSGMPVAMVSRLGARNEFSEFKSVLNDAQNQVMTPVDAEAMARELVQSNGREYVEMVRELSESLAQTKRELEEANRRYERLTADLARRGIRIDDTPPARQETELPAKGPDSAEDRLAEWEEWDRRFQSLLG